MKNRPPSSEEKASGSKNHLLVLMSVLLAIFFASAWWSNKKEGLSATRGSRPHGSAAPGKFIDASLDLEIDLRVEDANVCVMWPKHLVDAAACAGLDTDTAAKRFARAQYRPLVMGALRYDDGTATINIFHVPNNEIRAKEQVDGFFAGLANGMAEGMGLTESFKVASSSPDSPYDLLKINGIDAGHFEIIPQASQDGNPISHQGKIVYVLFSPSGYITLLFSSDPQHMGRLRQSVASILKTVRWSAASLPDFGKPMKLPELDGGG